VVRNPRLRTCAVMKEWGERSASAEDRPGRVACHAPQPGKISVRFPRAFAAARVALRKMCMWWRGPHHAGSGAKLRARQVRTAVAQIDSRWRAVQYDFSPSDAKQLYMWLA
jgi:hypothetical protein